MSKKLNPSHKAVESGKATKLQVGKPRSYMPDELEEAAEKYFEYCKNYKIEHPTGSGKVVTVIRPRVPDIGEFVEYLKISRTTLDNYEELPEYVGTIKRIRERIDGRKDSAMINGEGNTVGLIFDAKVNRGKIDKQTIQHEGEIKVTLNLD